ncbi:30S ribosomal protein S1, partial [Thermodesulfobacteriota bacterium]
VEAAVVKITPEWTFLDLGGKSEGIIDTKELRDAEGACSVREGDRIKAYFLSAKNNEKLFSMKLGTGSAGNEHLTSAFESGVPVEGSVVKEIRGGFEVKVAGNTRAFCPYSQMGLRRVENAEEYVGQKLPFKITEYAEDGRNIVLSNRALLEEERREQKEALKASLQEGMLVKGTVSSVRDFGAFVDIGGIEGLIPISEIGWSRVDRVADVLAPGQEVEVKVLSIDWEKERISFSMKALLPDPWEAAAAAFPEGSAHTGTVVRLAKFGAFVSLAPGIDGLVHISKLGAGKRLAHPGEAVSEGDTLDVTVQSVDAEKRRISLVPAETAGQKQDAAEDKAMLKKYVQKPSKAVSSTGALGTLGDALKAKLAEKRQSRE